MYALFLITPAIMAGLSLKIIKGKPPERGIVAFAKLMIFGFIIQALQVALALFSVNNIFLHHVYHPVEFYLTLTTFGWWNLEKKHILNAVRTVVSTILIVDIVMTSAKEIPSTSLMISSVFVVAISLYVLVGWSNLKSYQRYLVLGLLLYYAENAILIMFIAKLNLNLPLVLHAIFLTISNILIILGLSNGSKLKYIADSVQPNRCNDVLGNYVLG